MDDVVRNALDVEWLQRFVADGCSDDAARAYGSSARPAAEAQLTSDRGLFQVAENDDRSTDLHSELLNWKLKLERLHPLPWSDKRKGFIQFSEANAVNRTELIGMLSAFRKRDIALFVYDAEDSLANVDDVFSHFHIAIEQDVGLLKVLLVSLPEVNEYVRATYRDHFRASVSGLYESRGQSLAVVVSICHKVALFEPHWFLVDDVCEPMLQQAGAASAERIVHLCRQDLGKPLPIGEMVARIRECFPHDVVLRSATFARFLESTCSAVIDAYRAWTAHAIQEVASLKCRSVKLAEVLSVNDRLADAFRMLERQYALGSTEAAQVFCRTGSVVLDVHNACLQTHLFLIRHTVLSCLEAANWQDRFSFLQGTKPLHAIPAFVMNIQRLCREIRTQCTSRTADIYNSALACEAVGLLLRLYAEVRPSEPRFVSLCLDVRTILAQIPDCLLTLLAEADLSLFGKVQMDRLRLSIVDSTSFLILFTAPHDEVFSLLQHTDFQASSSANLSSLADFLTWLSLHSDDWHSLVAFAVGTCSDASTVHSVLRGRPDVRKIQSADDL
eukprot:ANDGO_02108.mRNA.1 hypothetical protein